MGEYIMWSGVFVAVSVFAIAYLLIVVNPEDLDE